MSVKWSSDDFALCFEKFDRTSFYNPLNPEILILLIVKSHYLYLVNCSGQEYPKKKKKNLGVSLPTFFRRNTALIDIVENLHTANMFNGYRIRTWVYRFQYVTRFIEFNYFVLLLLRIYYLNKYPFVLNIDMTYEYLFFLIIIITFVFVDAHNFHTKYTNINIDPFYFNILINMFCVVTIHGSCSKSFGAWRSMGS